VRRLRITHYEIGRPRQVGLHIFVIIGVQALMIPALMYASFDDRVKRKTTNIMTWHAQFLPYLKFDV